jgi:hypothetical protein
VGFFLGLGLGILSLMTVLFLFETVENRLKTVWCSLWGRNGKAGLHRRLKSALSPNRFPMFLPWLLGLLNPIFLLVIAPNPWNMIALGCLSGYVGLSVLTFPFFLGKKLRAFREELAVYAAGKLAKREEPEFAKEILLAAASSKNESMRFAATIGLPELGSAEAEEALAKLCSDRVTRISVSAMKAYRNLLKVRKLQEIQSVKGLGKLRADFDQEKRLVHYREGWDSMKSFPKLARFADQIDKIIYSQLLLRQGYPALFCEKCHAFAERAVHDDWHWVYCPICNDAIDLKPGIERVIGTIGAGSDWDLQDGILRISLWDRIGKRPVYAEIEALEIVEDETLDLDWAVSAVLEMLHNKHLPSEGQIGIRYIGHPKLGTNVQHILRKFGVELDLPSISPQTSA